MLRREYSISTEDARALYDIAKSYWDFLLWQSPEYDPQFSAYLTFFSLEAFTENVFEYRKVNTCIEKQNIP